MSFGNTRIIARLSLGFGVIILMVAGLGAFALDEMNTLATQTEKLYQHPMAVSNAALEARGDINAIRRELLNSVLARTDEDAAKASKRISELEVRVHDNFQILNRQYLGDKTLIEHTFRQFDAWKPVRDDILKALRTGRRDDALALIYGESLTRAAAIAQGINEIIEFAKQKGVDFYKNAAAQRDLAFRTIFIIVGAILGFGVLVALLITRSLTGPIGALRDIMVRLADGDYQASVPFVERTNEIGEMARTVQVFKENGLEKLRRDAAERERLAAERESAEAQRRREEAIGREIAALIDGVARGDLTRRIDLAGKDGFYLAMSEGINRLTDTIQTAIADIARVIKALAEGDLGQRITKDYQGAFDGLKNDINGTSVRLSGIVGQISQATDTISSAAGEVATGSGDLAERTEQQASSLEETAASMEELGATVRSNAENAQRANRMASDAQTAAEQGGTVAASAIAAMKRIDEASRKITDIIGVIDEIAFQTNLLALNAAVEAARAGDAGKGFAVVAQEVRVLAQRSAQASKEIKTLILASDGQVKEGVELVGKAGDALGGIVAGVQQVARLISEMASASTEQASALDEINATVAQMDEMTQKNAALVEETTAAAQSMESQSGELRQLMAFFKVDHAAAGLPAAVQPAPMVRGGGQVGSARVGGGHILPGKPAHRAAKAGNSHGVAAHGAGGAGQAAKAGNGGGRAAGHKPAPAAGTRVLHRADDDGDADWKEF